MVYEIILIIEENIYFLYTEYVQKKTRKTYLIRVKKMYLSIVLNKRIKYIPSIYTIKYGFPLHGKHQKKKKTQKRISYT